MDFGFLCGYFFGVRTCPAETVSPTSFEAGDMPRGDAKGSGAKAGWMRLRVAAVLEQALKLGPLGFRFDEIGISSL